MSWPDRVVSFLKSKERRISCTQDAAADATAAAAANVDVDARRMDGAIEHG